jgi:hypothetical protein
LSRRTISPQEYGQGILNVLKLNVVGFEMNDPLPAFANHRKTIEHRIRHIIRGDSMKPRRALSVTVTTALIGLFLLPMAANNRNAAEGQTNANIEKDASANSLEGWFALKFDPSVHTETKLPGELQSNKINPNLKPPQRQLQSFQSSIDNHFRPGVEYFTGDAPVRAVAGGIVHFVGQMPVGAGKVDGLYIRVAHDFYDGYPRVTLYRNQAYRSSYYYLSRVVVEHWQTVKRGQIIGYGSKYSADNRKKAVIVLEERGNWINPDNYGPGHGFMNHWDGKTNLEIDLEEMNYRLDRQIEIVKKLYSYYAKRDRDNLYNKLHAVIDTEKYKNYPVKWSTIDRFKYLSHLYRKDRELFPNLSLEEFEALTKEFYGNQPIVLTLPFK